MLEIANLFELRLVRDTRQFLPLETLLEFDK